jgi:signal transduction histidine kinase
LKVGERVAGWVAEQKIPVLLQGALEENMQFSALEGRKDVKSALCAPLKVGDTVVGVLSLNRLEDGGMPRFTQAELRAAVTFARYCAAAIQNARLCETLMARSQQLAEQARVWSLWLAELCHELNTPVSAIRSYLSNVLAGDLGALPQKVQECLARAKEQVEKVVGFLEEMRLASDRELRLGEVGASVLAAAAAKSVEVWREEKGLKIVFDVPADLPCVWADKAKVEQVLVNLLRNAMKFSEPGGEIALSAIAGENEVQFCVADRGAGIPQESIELIFEQFYRADGTQEISGEGLGLAISKKIVEAHGGRIWARSEPGKGSVFYFALPLRAGGVRGG